jgi:hypothetical protein
MACNQRKFSKGQNAHEKCVGHFAAKLLGAETIERAVSAIGRVAIR